MPEIKDPYLKCVHVHTQASGYQKLIGSNKELPMTKTGTICARK